MPTLLQQQVVQQQPDTFMNLGGLGNNGNVGNVELSFSGSDEDRLTGAFCPTTMIRRPLPVVDPALAGGCSCKRERLMTYADMVKS